MALEITAWISIGALSGWIGFLVNKPDNRSSVGMFIIIGMVSGLLGGKLSEAVGLPEVDGAFDAASSALALFVSAMVIVIFSVMTGLFNKK